MRHGVGWEVGPAVSSEAASLAATSRQSDGRESAPMIYFLKLLLGALVWVVANVVYVDMKRKGIRGFTRFAAFWTGTPTTWISLFAIKEGSQRVIDPPPDDEGEALLADIRRDRALRPGDLDGVPDHEPGSVSGPGAVEGDPDMDADGGLGS